MVSIQVLATPMSGLRRSASVKPMALNMDRAGARSRPSVIPRLRCFKSMEEGYNRDEIASRMVEHEKRKPAAEFGQEAAFQLQVSNWHDAYPGSVHAC